MLGEVAIGIIMLESDGSIDPSTEDWSPLEIQQVSAEMVKGLEWWKDQAGAANVFLDYIIAPEHPIVVPTSYEPITHPGGPSTWVWNGYTGEEGLWIDEAMTYLGYDNYSQTGYYQEVLDYANDLRAELETDWVVVVFVVDDSNDTDGLLANKISGYVPNLGDPYNVMTFTSGGREIIEFGGVEAHEPGHNFGSPDEETGTTSCQSTAACSKSWGYLYVPNQNCNLSACARPDNMCIMRSPYFNTNQNIINTTCYYTQGHVGWHDSDADGIPNPRDTEPTLTINGYPSSPSPSYVLTYDATVMDIPWSTTNPNYINVTINTVYVEYRIGSTGSWQRTIAGDGAWDSPYEEDFKIAIFQNSTFHIYLRAINEVGHTSAVVNHTITINSSYPIYRAFLPLAMRNY